MSTSISLPGKFLLINSRDYNLCLDVCEYCGSALKKPGQKFCNKKCRVASNLCIQCKKNPQQINNLFCNTKCAVDATNLNH